jgi:hypothetical protein
MANEYPFSLKLMKELPREWFLPYARLYERELESMSSAVLDAVATLLCKAAPKALKLRFPVYYE